MPVKSVALVLNSKTAMLHDLTVIRADNCMTILNVIELSSIGLNVVTILKYFCCLVLKEKLIYI